MLRRVLRAVVWNKQAPNAYVQSMNFIAAFLLCFMSEEEAYWMMRVVTEDILIDYHICSIRGVLLDEGVFTSLLESHSPSVYKHFISLGIPFALFIIPWFLCMYVNYLPWDQLQAMFDCAFARGRNVLIRVALAILDINRSRILSINDAASLLDFLKNTRNLMFEGALETALNKFGSSVISDFAIDSLRNKVPVPDISTFSSLKAPEAELQRILLPKKQYGELSYEEKRKSTQQLQTLFVNYSLLEKAPKKKESVSSPNLNRPKKGSAISSSNNGSHSSSSNNEDNSLLHERKKSSSVPQLQEENKKKSRVMDRINHFLDSISKSLQTIDLNCGDFSCAPSDPTSASCSFSSTVDPPTPNPTAINTKGSSSSNSQQHSINS
eukprot:TRINITY_DN4949_c0_g1_i2.p2 TRINITY_DN4949_c0_g1~~TRINITY_DN4949_c0_g1_i2.p2  ORF type:complete len:381 (-),score=111.51 TRINITY_DN4949_c0_g1_i2:89-1231(-)